MTASPPAPYQTLSIFSDDGQLAVQPKGSGPGPVDTLSINLDIGKAQVLKAIPQPGTSIDVLAILGMCKLHAGNALIVVTSAKPVAQINGADVFEITEAQVLTSSAARANSANRGLLRLLRESVDPMGSGRGLHFSYGYDLTCTMQHNAATAAADPAAWSAQLPVERANSRFFWNKVVAQPLVAAGAAAFVQPCILGFVQQLPELHFNDTKTGRRVTGSVTLIARRAAARAGTRQWRRGADNKGNVANFAETEQIVSFTGPEGWHGTGHTAAYLITRGSIPLLWTQLPNIKYKPTTVIGPSDVSGPAHDKHFAAMADAYKTVVAINLINHHGTEGRLEAAFRSEMTRLVSTPGPLSNALKYVAFDFHAECGGRRYHRLSLLWDRVAEDFKQQGFCRLAKPAGNGGSAAEVVGQQQGVLRVNCIDCLDRTNVVQGVMARKALEAMLTSYGLLQDGSNLPQAYPDIERQFKILWADHGDALSTQYAGTGAMKSGFTRTGKRTIGGVIDDGVKAVVRYYLNNFQDGVKQDAIDLFTGTYQCDTVHAPSIKSQPSPLIPLLVSVLALSLTAHNLAAILSYTFSGIPAPTSMPAVGAAPAAADGLLGHARSLLSSVVFQAPLADPGNSSIEAATIALNPTAGTVAEATKGPGLAVMAGNFAMYVLLPLSIGVGLVVLVLQNGKYLVNKPQLCPQLAVTVQRPSKRDVKKQA